MSEAYGDTSTSRSSQLDRILTELVGQVPEIEAASVVSFDGLAMAAALPAAMDEDRVAAMSAALLSLGERAAEGLGRGALSQVYVEGENGTVFLISADDEAVLVAVAAKGAKAGLMLFEVRRAAAAVADALRDELGYDAVPAAGSVAAAPLPAPAPAPLQVVSPPSPDYGVDSTVWS
jgi:predicted regulator of Ras-like GTPase activity (Roadblock/LC7/MglB family)